MWKEQPHHNHLKKTSVTWGGSEPPDDISRYRKIILQIMNQIEWDELKLDN